MLIGLVPRLTERRDAAAAQGLFDFIVYGGSSIGPALVGGLSSVVNLDHALAVAAGLPAAGIAAGLTLRHRHIEVAIPGGTASSPLSQAIPSGPPPPGTGARLRRAFVRHHPGTVRRGKCDTGEFLGDLPQPLAELGNASPLTR